MIKAQIYDVFCDELAQGNPCGVVELNHSSGRSTCHIICGSVWQ